MTLLYSGKPNESAVRDATLDALYDEALRTYDPSRAAALWKKLERYVYDRHLLLIGYQEKAVFGAHPRLRFTPRTLMSFWDAAYEG
jgi:ABC-type transport system substrate-binding protein